MLFRHVIYYFYQIGGQSPKIPIFILIIIISDDNFGVQNQWCIGLVPDKEYFDDNFRNISYLAFYMFGSF